MMKKLLPFIKYFNDKIFIHIYFKQNYYFLNFSYISGKKFDRIPNISGLSI